MCFDFLGYSGWVFTERIGDTDVAHLVIQGILDELAILGSQVFILFHSRYLLKPETQQEKNSIKEAVKSVEKGRRLFHPYQQPGDGGDDGGDGPLRGIIVVIQSEFRTLFFKVTSALKPEFTLKIEVFKLFFILLHKTPPSSRLYR